MHIKYPRSGSNICVQLTQSYRYKKGKPRHRVMLNLGRKDELKNSTIVDDIIRGLLSKKVLQEIVETGYEYIVAAKLKSLPKQHHQQVLDRSQYRQINEERWLSEMDIDGKRLVLGYSTKRAGRDRKQREEVLKKLEVKLGNNSAKSVVNSQYSRFLSVGKTEVKIDPEKIKEAERWDGIFGYYTNNKALTQEEVLDSCHLLWQVEDAF